MREIKYYEAYDGSLFNTVEACREYELNNKNGIIEDFKKLIVRQSVGYHLTRTKEGLLSFPLAETVENWWYAVIIMHNEDDYKKVKRYAKIVENKNSKAKKIFDTEIIVGIGDGDNVSCDYNWFYWYGTVDEAIENYKNTLLTFNEYGVPNGE